MLNKYLFNTNIIKIKSGEQNKTLDSAQHIWNELQKMNADKKSVLINLGGGVIGDIGGFCAATFKRGLDFINIPTTLLSMVDSSIGGKLGVDFNGVKNAVGIIQQPHAIYINPDFLNSLPKDEIVNGYAEILKHALIADIDYWEKLSRTGLDEWQKMGAIINSSVKIKLQIIKKDPTEKSTRKLLNFGHTIGHAIEAYSLKHDKKPLKHGEAVAIGMICEGFLSKEILGFSTKDLRLISEYILRFFPKYSLKTILSPELIKLMRQDKKNQLDEINFTLLKRIGKASIDHVCGEHQISMALNYYDSL
jgi:3-dehydroquinate synthase